MGKIAVSKLPSALKELIEHKYNVLIEGPHGIGKTACVKEIFNEKYGNDWLYFSAPTMDPYIDFVGVPKVIENDGEYLLKLIRNEKLRTAKALFFDELNRAPRKVLNSIFELIQFRTINGVPLDNIEVIWAAINPPGEQYDVNNLDPAVIDRFHAYVIVEQQFPIEFFTKRFSRDIATSVKKWWENLTSSERSRISFRRIEYAVDYIVRTNKPPIHIMPSGEYARELYSAVNKISTKIENLLNRVEEIADAKNQEISTDGFSLNRIIDQKFSHYNNVFRKIESDGITRAIQAFGEKILRDYVTDLGKVIEYYVTHGKSSLHSDIANVFANKRKLSLSEKATITLTVLAVDGLDVREKLGKKHLNRFDTMIDDVVGDLLYTNGYQSNGFITRTSTIVNHTNLPNEIKKKIIGALGALKIFDDNEDGIPRKQDQNIFANATQQSDITLFGTPIKEYSLHYARSIVLSYFRNMEKTTQQNIDTYTTVNFDEDE